MDQETAKSQDPGGGLLTAQTLGADEQEQVDTGQGGRSGWDEPLQRLALALIRAVSLDDVAAAVAAYGTVAAGARWCHVLLLDEHGAPGISLFGGPGVPSRRLEKSDLDSALDGLDTVGPVVTTPLVAVRDRCGTVTFGFDGPADGVVAPRAAPLEEIAALASRAAARAAFYASEHQSAELLQRAYLPMGLSTIAGLSFASRYLPAGEPVAVGGDWYDVIPLAGGGVSVVMGDVAGHGLRAAAVMASLRAGLRAFSTVDPCPARILDRLNGYTCLFKPDAFATVFVGAFDPGAGRLLYARAGHPPPLLIARDGTTVLLDDALGPPLGVTGGAYKTGEAPFPVGASLVAYTDGLIERRNESLDDRLATLVGAAPAAAGSGPEILCDRLIFELLAGKDLTDDAALLVATRLDPTL
jgi:stage II sporulation SpoE-like protein